MSITATFNTNRGTINVQLHDEGAPLTVANFVNLSRRGFYDGLSFHRVIADFIVQCGCPEGTGRGGPGYQFEDEFNPELRHETAGVLSMANAGPATNGSQFFITHNATPWLDDRHSVFGQVVSDDDQTIVNAITMGDTLDSVQVEGDVEDLLERMSDRVADWNAILDTHG